MRHTIRLAFLAHVGAMVMGCTPGDPGQQPPPFNVDSGVDSGIDSGVPGVPYPTEKVMGIDRSVTRMVRAGDIVIVGEKSSSDGLGNRLADGRLWQLDASGTLKLFAEGYADPTPVGADSQHVYFYTHPEGVSWAPLTLHRQAHHSDEAAEELFIVPTEYVTVQEGFVLYEATDQVYRVATAPLGAPEPLFDTDGLEVTGLYLQDDVLYVGTSEGIHVVPLAGGTTTLWSEPWLGAIVGSDGAHLFDSGSGRAVLQTVDVATGARVAIGGVVSWDVGCIVADLHVEDDRIYWFARSHEPEGEDVGSTTISTGAIDSWVSVTDLMAVPGTQTYNCPGSIAVVGGLMYSTHWSEAGPRNDVYVTPVPSTADAGI